MNKRNLIADRWVVQHTKASMLISVILELAVVEYAGIGSRRGLVPVAGASTTWNGNRVSAQHEHVYRTHTYR